MISQESLDELFSCFNNCLKQKELAEKAYEINRSPKNKKKLEDLIKDGAMLLNLVFTAQDQKKTSTP